MKKVLSITLLVFQFTFYKSSYCQQTVVDNKEEEGTSEQASAEMNGPIGVEQLNPISINSCWAYPNPARDKITIVFNEKYSGGNVSVIGEDGKTFFEKSAICSFTQIDIAELPVGIYFIRFSHEKNNESLKFVKE